MVSKISRLMKWSHIWRKLNWLASHILTAYGSMKYFLKFIGDCMWNVTFKIWLSLSHGTPNYAFTLKQYYEICSQVRPQYTFYSTNFLSFTCNIKNIENRQYVVNMKAIRVVVMTQSVITFPLPGSRCNKK